MALGSTGIHGLPTHNSQVQSPHRLDRQLLVLGLLPQQLLCAHASIPVAFSYCSKSQDHFPVCKHPVLACALEAVLSSLTQQSRLVSMTQGSAKLLEKVAMCS